jgi:hypothetical protein
MSYSSSYSSSISSSTSTTTTTNTSTGDETSSSSLTADMTVQSASSDGSDGLSAALGGEAVALGEDTLTVGSVSAEMEDGGAVTTLDGTATMAAASEDPDGEAQALTDTFAEVSDSAEFVFVANVETSSNEQNKEGSTATSTSTTQVTAYNLESSGDEDGDVDAVDPVADDKPTATDASESTNEVSSSSPEADWNIDGNIAIAEFDAIAIGDDSFVNVDAFALAIEDELSASAVAVELGTG